jgi:hypothetical protein
VLVPVQQVSTRHAAWRPVFLQLTKQLMVGLLVSAAMLQQQGVWPSARFYLVNTPLAYLVLQQLVMVMVHCQLCLEPLVLTEITSA